MVDLATKQMKKHNIDASIKQNILNLIVTSKSWYLHFIEETNTVVFRSYDKNFNLKHEIKESINPSRQRTARTVLEYKCSEAYIQF